MERRMEVKRSVNSGHPVFDRSGEEAFPVILPLSELPKRVTLKESPLKPNRALAPPDTAVLAEIDGFILADQKTSSIACMLTTSFDSIVFLCIRNAAVIRSDSSIAYCKMLFPSSRIAIKSGIVRSIRVEKHLAFPAIYVASPAAIEFLGPSLENSKLPVEIMDSNGNEAFASNQFVAASLWFKAVQEAVQDDPLALAGSHLDYACCILKLQRHEEAILSFTQAIELDPELTPAFYHRAVGFNAARCQRAALDDLLRVQELLRRGSDRDGDKGRVRLENVEKSLPPFIKLAEQQESGVFDDEIREFFLQGCDPMGAPGFADFTSGAIEIRMTSDGRGRGMFLTREVRAGELLMVSNPLVVADSIEELQVFAIRACRSTPCSRIRRALKLLQDPESSSQQMPLSGIHDFTFDPTGSSYRWVEEDGGAIDVGRIKRAVEQASKLSFRITNPAGDRLSNKQLFLLPSFINHSCLPNSIMVAVGGALFIRAAAPISAGEEITISYIDCLQPLATRSKMIKKSWDFTCSCRRCEVETRFKKVLQSVPEFHTTSIEALVKRIDKLESALAKMSSNLSEEERGMIQIGHIQAYLRVAAGRLQDQKICREIGERFKLVSEIEAMKLLRRFAPGHGKGIALIARVVRECLLRLEWHPSFEVEFDDAIAAMIGSISLPSEDYITLLDHLQSDQIVASLFGDARTGD